MLWEGEIAVPNRCQCSSNPRLLGSPQIPAQSPFTSAAPYKRDASDASHLHSANACGAIRLSVGPRIRAIAVRVQLRLIKSVKLKSGGRRRGRQSRSSHDSAPWRGMIETTRMPYGSRLGSQPDFPIRRYRSWTRKGAGRRPPCSGLRARSLGNDPNSATRRNAGIQIPSGRLPPNRFPGPQERKTFPQKS